MSHSIFLKIAGFNIKIIFREARLKAVRKVFEKSIVKLYGGFIENRKSRIIDFSIEMIQRHSTEFFMKEPEKINFTSFYQRKDSNKMVTYYDISMAQFNFVCYDILEELLHRNSGFILHASAINYHNKAILFSGKAGSGKSTISRLLGFQYPVLSDDTVFIRNIDGHFYLYQNNMLEKNPKIRKSKQGYLISRIFFLRKSRNFNMVNLTDKQYIISRLFKQLVVNKRLQDNQLRQCIEFANKSDFYMIYFAKSRKLLEKLFPALLN